jgi:hypothetical protein
MRSQIPTHNLVFVLTAH